MQHLQQLSVLHSDLVDVVVLLIVAIQSLPFHQHLILYHFDTQRSQGHVAVPFTLV